MRLDNAQFEFPKERFNVIEREIVNGKVTILHFEGGTVAVKIEQDGEKDYLWVNKRIYLDPETGINRIVQED